MKCKGCEKNRRIQNKFLGLCSECVSKKNKTGKYSEKTKDKIDADEEFYEEVFDEYPCVCEECGHPLNRGFRDEHGRVINRFQYSHILPKSTYPELRHEVNNMGKLCLDCHNKWEHNLGNGKRSMNVWKPYVKRLSLIGYDLELLIKSR